MYVIPFLSADNLVNSVDGNVNMVLPYQSAVSSAPTTCTPCPLYEFNISVGGHNFFGTSLKYTYEFYDENVLELIGNLNGNSMKSPLTSGLITKNMFSLMFLILNEQQLKLMMISRKIYMLTSNTDAQKQLIFFAFSNIRKNYLSIEAQV